MNDPTDELPPLVLATHAVVAAVAKSRHAHMTAVRSSESSHVSMCVEPDGFTYTITIEKVHT